MRDGIGLRNRLSEKSPAVFLRLDDSIEAELREPGLSAERRELLAVSLATLRAREAAALERLHAESALAQLKMADWNASR